MGLQKWLDAAGGLSCKVGDGASLSRCHIHHICNSSPTKRAIAHVNDADRSSLNCSGERQLFCLARVLLKSTSLVVFDEAESAILNKQNSVSFYRLFHFFFVPNANDCAAGTLDDDAAADLVTTSQRLLSSSTRIFISHRCCQQHSCYCMHTFTDRSQACHSSSHCIRSVDFIISPADHQLC